MNINNTYKHISDKSEFNTFDPNGTSYPLDVKNVQQALALTSPTQPATEMVAGIIEIATQDEVNAGIDDTKAVSPKKLAERLNYPIATETEIGVLSLATNLEAQTGIVTNKAIVPSSLKHTLEWYWANKIATESENGVLKLSTSVAAVAGTDDTTAMTPLKVKQAIAYATSNLPTPTAATELTQGLVRLATIGQATQGTLRDGYAISPYTLANLKGSLTVRGVVQAATQVQANVGTDDTLFVSAKGFKTYVATTTNVGTVKLSETVQDGSGLALAANAKVLPTSGGTVTGTLNVIGELKANGSNVASEQFVKDHSPVGSILMWVSDILPSINWAIADGGAESKSTNPELFAVIGYKFGGSGDVFYRPDMRGLFVRGVGVGKDIIAETGKDTKGKNKLGVGVRGGSAGEVQKQQVRDHKHIIPWGEVRAETPNFPFGGTQLSNYFGTNGQEDHDNGWMFSNDGTEHEPESIRTEYSTVNSKELIGSENRPWNMSVHYIIKVK